MNLTAKSPKASAYPSNEVFVVNNYTPLMIAVHLNKQKAVSHLLKLEKTNRKAKSKDGLTALDIAKQHKNKPLAKLLRKAKKR